MIILFIQVHYNSYLPKYQFQNNSIIPIGTQINNYHIYIIHYPIYCTNTTSIKKILSICNFIIRLLTWRMLDKVLF